MMSPSDQQLAALQQRYGQTQQLVDLLALQKLKQDKEAAARDMQMKMAQQQMAQGGLPTIKDQLESQVLGMTKQEVAQQVTDIAQQKQQQQQKALQQLAQSGIAQNPAPNMNFAGGGIVAFQEGGETSSALGRVFKPAVSALRSLVSPGGMSNLGEIKAIAAEVERLQRRKRELGGRFGMEQQSPEQAAEYDRVNDKLMELENQLAQMRSGQKPAEQPARGTLGEGFENVARTVSDIPVMPGQAKPPAPPRQTAPVAQPTPAAQPEMPAMPAAPAAPAQPAAPSETEGLGSLLASISKELIQANPTVRAGEEEKYREGRLALTPEQQAVYDRGIANARRRMEELSDPERMNREARIRGMLAAAGGGGFAAYGAGDLNAQEQQRLARKQAEEELMKTELGLVDLQRANVLKGLEGREAELGRGASARDRGLQAGTTLYQTDVTAKTASDKLAADVAMSKADRESRERVADKQIAATIRAAQISAEGRLESALARLQNRQQLTSKDLAEIEKLGAEAYEKHVNSLGKDEKPLPRDAFMNRFRKQVGLETTESSAAGSLSAGKDGTLQYTPPK